VTETQLVLVRHGQTVWHAENRYAGSSDIDLTDAGREQARRLADWAAQQRRFDALVSSPVRRAVETVTPVAQRLDTPVRIVDDLREVGFGLAEGRTTAELRELDAEMVEEFELDPAGHPYPGSEDSAAAALRCATALRQLAKEFAGGRVLVVAHNTVLRLALCDLLDIPVSRYRRVFPQLYNVAITVLVVPTDGHSLASLVALNDRMGRDE
jgi:probable phosphoglycerate mutase